MPKTNPQLTRVNDEALSPRLSARELVRLCVFPLRSGFPIPQAVGQTQVEGFPKSN